MGYMDTYRSWCEDSYFDEETKAELLAIKDNENEIRERFYKDLEFGTGGLRGILGAGTNRMNVYTSDTRSGKLYQSGKRRVKRRGDRV